MAIVSPSPKIIAQYDYEEIEAALRQGNGWSAIARNKIANPNGKDRRNVQRWYEREATIRQTTRGIQRQITQAVQRGKKQGVENNAPGIGSLPDKPIVLPRTYNPLRNPPTRFKSGLHIDDWIIKYCRYPWKEEYLTEMREFLLNIYYQGGKGLIFEPRKSGKTLSSIGVYVYSVY